MSGTQQTALFGGTGRRLDTKDEDELRELAEQVLGNLSCFIEEPSARQKLLFELAQNELKLAQAEIALRCLRGCFDDGGQEERGGAGADGNPANDQADEEIDQNPTVEEFDVDQPATACHGCCTEAPEEKDKPKEDEGLMCSNSHVVDSPHSILPGEQDEIEICKLNSHTAEEIGRAPAVEDIAVDGTTAEISDDAVTQFLCQDEATAKISDDEVTQFLHQIFGDDVDLEKVKPMKIVKALMAKGQLDVKNAVTEMRSVRSPAGIPRYPQLEFGTRWSSQKRLHMQMEFPPMPPQLWFSAQKQKQHL